MERESKSTLTNCMKTKDLLKSVGVKDVDVITIKELVTLTKQLMLVIDEFEVGGNNDDSPIFPENLLNKITLKIK